MSQEDIHNLAGELAGLLPMFPWRLLIVQTLLMIGAAAIGAYFSEYLKTKGRNLATKEDFATLTDQMQTTTKLVEQVKAEISRKEWHEREWAMTRRNKLEALLNKCHEVEAYLNSLRNSAVDGLHKQERDPLGEFESIVALYFPDLDQVAHDYSMACRAYAISMQQNALAMLGAGQDVSKRTEASSAIAQSSESLYPAVAQGRSKLFRSARNLMRQIANA